MVDNEGEEIFADKVGVMLARDISAQYKGATFVADVKSTGLFMTEGTGLALEDSFPAEDITLTVVGH